MFLVQVASLMWRPSFYVTFLSGRAWDGCVLAYVWVPAVWNLGQAGWQLQVSFLASPGGVRAGFLLPLGRGESFGAFPLVGLEVGPC